MSAATPFLTDINDAMRDPDHAGYRQQKGPVMTNPLAQTPVLVFALMMASFILTLGPIALADILRARR